MGDSSEAVGQLLSLGITESEQVASRALELADGDLEKACNMIMEGRLDLTAGVDEAKVPTTPEPAASAADSGAELKPDHPEPEPQLEPEPEPEPELVSEPPATTVPTVISMADPTTPLLLQNIRVTAMLLQNETAEMGDPELSRLTDTMLGHFKEVVQYITTHSSGASGPFAAATVPAPRSQGLAPSSTEPGAAPEPEPEPEPKPEPDCQPEPVAPDDEGGDALARLLSITGAPDRVGRAALTLAGGNLGRAVEMVLTDDSSLAAAAAAEPGADPAASAQGPTSPVKDGTDTPVAELNLQPFLEDVARVEAEEPPMSPPISEHTQKGLVQLQAGDWAHGYETFSALFKTIQDQYGDLTEDTEKTEVKRALRLRSLCVQGLLICNLRRCGPMISMQSKRVHGELRSESVAINIPRIHLGDTCTEVASQHEVADAAWRTAFPAAVDAVDDAIGAVLGRLNAFIGDTAESSSELHWSQLREKALAAEADECRFIRTSSWTLVAKTAPLSSTAWAADTGTALVRAPTTISSTPMHVSGSNDGGSLARPTRRLILPLVEEAMGALTTAERPFVDTKQVDGGLLVQKQHELVIGRESPPSPHRPESAEADMQRAMELSMKSLDDPPETDGAAAPGVSSKCGTNSSPAVLAQLRVVSGRGGRCGHHALHNAMLGATVATVPGLKSCPAAASFLGDMLRDVAFWSRYHEHVAMIKAEAQRREVDVVSIAEGRSTWAPDLPKLGEDHELTESQMNYLLRVNPEVGLLGGAARFLVFQTIGGKPRFLLSEMNGPDAEDELPSPIPVATTSFGEDDEEGEEAAALREALALSLAGGEEPSAAAPTSGEGIPGMEAAAPTPHPAMDLQKSIDEWRRSDTATRAVVVGVHPVTDAGAAGWGHWVAFVANKFAGSREYILLDSDNHPLLSFRDTALLNAYTKEAGLKARLSEQLNAVDLLCAMFEGEIDLRTRVAESLIDEKLQDCQKHLASRTSTSEQEAAMAQLEQWIPAEELASGIGALLGEQGLSAEAKVEQIRAYAAQRGIPINVDAGDDSAFIEALMSWGDFDAVASWRGVDGILTQLKTLGTYVTASKRAELRDWAGMLRRRWDSAGPEARGFALSTISETPDDGSKLVYPFWVALRDLEAVVLNAPPTPEPEPMPASSEASNPETKRSAIDGFLFASLYDI